MKGKVTYFYNNNMNVNLSSSDSYEQFNSYIFYQILAIYIKQHQIKKSSYYLSIIMKGKVTYFYNNNMKGNSFFFLLL